MIELSLVSLQTPHDNSCVTYYMSYFKSHIFLAQPLILSNERS